MKIQVASDLHLELLPADWGARHLLAPHPDADLLVLAGDVHRGAQAIECFKDWPVPVLYVPGNHEFYGQIWEEARHKLQESAAGTAVRVLDNDSYQVGDARFLGTTLWTDFEIDRARPAASSMRLAATGLNDFFQIRSQRGDPTSGLLTPELLLEDHRASRSWLNSQLKVPFQGRTVVITHHAPHRLSVHRKYVGDPLTPAFASDLTDLLHQTDLWIHGHTHDSFDYKLGRCRVVSNPAGYALNRKSSLQSAADLKLENPAFDEGLVLALN